MKSVVLAVSGFIVSLLSSVAFSQSAVTDAQVDEVRRSIAAPTERDVDSVLKKMPKVPSDLGAGQRAQPNIDRIPQPLPSSKPNLADVVGGYDQAVADMMRGNQIGLAGPTLLIFVSFSNPEPSLVRLVDQASKVKATLVLKGLANGSLKDTVMRMRKLIGDRKVSVQIDPESFDRFGVSATPTFVLVRPNRGASGCSDNKCDGPDSSISVSGDVTVEYALRYMLDHAPAFRAESGMFLQRVKR